MTTSLNNGLDKPYYHLFRESDFFHVYNRSNNKEVIFPDDECFMSFLRLFKKYVADLVDVHAYCVLPNHFHFAIKVKSKKEVLATLGGRKAHLLNRTQRAYMNDPEGVGMHRLLSRQFGNMFNAYAQSYNHGYKRKGNVFNTNMNRLHVGGIEHLKWLIYYIHSNPWHHGMLEDYRQYRWSSICQFMGEITTGVDLKLVNAFTDMKDFWEYHQGAHRLKVPEVLLMPCDIEKKSDDSHD